MGRGRELGIACHSGPDAWFDEFFHICSFFPKRLWPLCFPSSLVWQPKAQAQSQDNLPPTPHLPSPVPQRQHFAKPLRLWNRENESHILCLGYRMILTQTYHVYMYSVSVLCLMACPLTVSVPLPPGSSSRFCFFCVPLECGELLRTTPYALAFVL